MSDITIEPDDLVRQDPDDVRLYQFDWNTDCLDIGVQIVTSVFSIRPARPSKVDAALVKDNENIPAKGTLRLSEGTRGQTYVIANTITTDETPPQTIKASFRLLIQNQ